jgi:predicted amidohydrolase
MSTDAADLFCRIFDEFEEPKFQPVEVADWLTDEQVADISSATEGQVLETGALDEEEIRDNIEMAEDSDRRRFAYLRGIDNALLHAHPHTATHDPAGLLAIASRYVRTGKFSTDSVLGALLPRFAFPATSTSSADLAESMMAAVRVPSDVWEQTDHVVIGGRSDLHRRHREKGVLFGCVPFLERVDELEWETAPQAGHSSFRSQIIPTDELRDRIVAVLHRLDDHGAMVGVLPEMCASAQVLEWWQEAVISNRAPRESNLRWIFVGTGAIAPDRDPPTNTGVLLDRLTGEVLLRQDKMHPFVLVPDQIQAWGLGDYVGYEMTREDISCGEKIAIAESRLGRLVVMICEDLARTMTLGPLMLTHGTSHALCPVLSDEIELHHWEHNKAKDYADQIGTQVIVANSRAIGCNQGETKFGTALAHSPHDTAIGSTSSAEDIVLLRLSDEAAIQAISRTAGFEDLDETPTP